MIFLGGVYFGTYTVRRPRDEITMTIRAKPKLFTITLLTLSRLSPLFKNLIQLFTSFTLLV